MTRKLYWKALSAGLKSQHDKSQWKIGEWRKTECKEGSSLGSNLA